MTKSEIKNTYSRLSEELRTALSTMERSDRIFAIRGEIKSLQEICPHMEQGVDFSHAAKHCPVCGKKF